jgi:hypothetical protein
MLRALSLLVIQGNAHESCAEFIGIASCMCNLAAILHFISGSLPGNEIA